MVKLLKIFPVVFLIATIAADVIYKKTSLEIWLTLAITFGTTAYHFIMRWVVAFIYNFIMQRYNRQRIVKLIRQSDDWQEKRTV